MFVLSLHGCARDSHRPLALLIEPALMLEHDEECDLRLEVGARARVRPQTLEPRAVAGDFAPNSLQHPPEVPLLVRVILFGERRLDFADIRQEALRAALYVVTRGHGKWMSITGRECRRVQ
jgi:hypothetical protein